MTNEVCLRCEGIERYLGEEEERVHALRGISLALEAGTIHSVVGPSGCGKSTLLYVLGLLDQPDRGQVTIESEPVSQLSDDELSRKRNELLGFIFQFHFLMEDFTAQENVMIPMRRLGRLTEEAMRARAAELLEAVGLGNKLSRPSRHLSGGEQQRVAVARALANDPRVILADEPTGNLDTKNSRVPSSYCRTLWCGTESAPARDAQPRYCGRLRLDPRNAGRTDRRQPSAREQRETCHEADSRGLLVPGSACELPNPSRIVFRSFPLGRAKLPGVYCRGDSAGQLCRVLLHPQST